MFFFVFLLVNQCFNIYGLSYQDYYKVY